MLLESLIRRLQAENGTPGTPEQKTGVPDSKPLESASRFDLAAAEHQEHREHPQNDSTDENELSEEKPITNGHGRPRCYDCSKFGPIGQESGCSKPGNPQFSMVLLIECPDFLAKTVH
jgi:hypothetical protein